MDETVEKATHGPQHDEFHAQANDQHGGSRFDEGFSSFAAAHTAAHGKLFDKFSKRPGVDRYGERWDEFPWTDMPVLHGNHYDEGYDSPSFDAGVHGRLHDVFRGARVRYMQGGQDVEGVVLQTQRDFAEVEDREGNRHEVTLPQILAYATAQGNPHADAKPKEAIDYDADAIDAKERDPHAGPQGERPSGESSRAMGGGKRSEVHYDESPFSNKRIGAALDVLKVDTFDADVEKMFEGAKDLTDDMLEKAHHKFSDHYSVARIAGNHPRAALAAQVLAHVHSEMAKRGMEHEDPSVEGPTTRGVTPGKTPLKSSPDTADVGKAVDSQESATQGQDLEGANQGAAWCKQCSHYCRKVQDGKCPTCGGPVSVKKRWDASLDVLKGEAIYRCPHATCSKVLSTEQAKGASCPHCKGRLNSESTKPLHAGTRWPEGEEL